MKPIAAMVTLVLAGVALAGCTAPTADDDAGHDAGADDATLGASLSRWYSDQPFTGGQKTPAHSFFKQPDGSFLFFHFNNDDVQQADQVLFVGDAKAGRFCTGDGGISQSDVDAGYVHFHKKSSVNWDAGHGGGPTYSASQDGYWFRHVSAMTGSMEMMGQTMQLTKGQVFPMMPSDQVPECP